MPPAPLPVLDVPKDLLAFLEGRYPLRPPTLNTPGRQVWIDAGIQEVLQTLRNLRAKAEQER